MNDAPEDRAGGAGAPGGDGTDAPAGAEAPEAAGAEAPGTDGTARGGRGRTGRWRASGTGPELTTGDTTVIARTSVRIVVPIVILTSLSLLFQGHILPGGGFIGGVLTATAFALVYIVYGLDHVRGGVVGVSTERAAEAAPEDRSGAYRTTFGVGLALAAGSGLVPLALAFVPGAGESLPFLTQAVFFLEHLPLYGEFEVASAFAFDLGVYLVVVGGILTVLREVGEE